MAGGKVTGKNAVIAIDDSGGTPRTLSTAANSYTIAIDSGKIDVTGFSEGTVNFTPGLPTHALTLALKFDSTATTGAFTVLNGIRSSATSKTVTITPETGGPVYSGEFLLDNLNVSATPTGGIEMQVAFSVMGGTAPAWA